MQSNKVLKVGIIGIGAIGFNVAKSIESGLCGSAQVVSILCRNRTKNLVTHCNESDYFKSIITDKAESFFYAKPDIVIEAAGQETLDQYAAKVLEQGIDLLVSSIGLFTDDSKLANLIEVANKSGAKILLSSGALPAVDWMSAASFSDVKEVSITQSKPTDSWKNTPAEDFINLNELQEPRCFFQGTAREAAALFPKSSNISAMLALATVGLDDTKVKLVADPLTSMMQTDISFESNVGHLKTHWQGVPSEMTPSTSADVPLAIVKAIRNMTSAVNFGV
ncbi:aspartate dehydrogenase [Reinekea thalattae]|uniref:L-aspartate dehydrogenase n=1 Tax=Reinekea thalattae TaxID=2593301 RepID=A0A5C8Z7U8_9GAMM|nr:aspartate dehydrogenase [Reinekea thalattae]TXR53373.1 aspartate dehydrogenase [Reinekea thalattae]